MPAAPGPTEDHLAKFDVTNDERKLWLVKLPDQVADAWEAEGAGSFLGVLKRHPPSKEAGPKKKMPKMEIRLARSKAPAAAKEMPGDFLLRHLSKPPSMRAFCVENRTVRVEGTFRETFAMEPSHPEKPEYRNFCRRRLIHNAVKKENEKVQKYDQTKVISTRVKKTDVFMPAGSDGRAGEGGGWGASAYKQKVSKMRTDPDQLRTHVFRLFERQPEYTFKEMNAHLGPICGEQEDGHLRRLLKTICDQIKEGSRYTFKLKSDYCEG